MASFTANLGVDSTATTCTYVNYTCTRGVENKLVVLRLGHELTWQDLGLSNGGGRHKLGELRASGNSVK